MSRTGILILLGILIVLVPFSGLPVALRTFLTVLFGASVIGLGFVLRARDARQAAVPPPPPAPAEPPQTISPV